MDDYCFNPNVSAVGKYFFFIETELCCRVLVWLMDEKRPINISTDDWCHYVYTALLPGTHETGKDDDKPLQMCPFNNADLY